MTTTSERPRQNLKPAFARHETFHLRDGWLYKGLNAVAEDGTALFAKDAHHQLGIGINMRKSMLYWLRATDLARPDVVQRGSPLSLKLTSTAELIRQYDPYLEDQGTLWLVHTLLASNREMATFWYWVFNEAPHRDFNEDRLVALVQELLEREELEPVTESSLHKDATCFIRTYLPAALRSKRPSAADSLDCPLSALGLIREAGLPGMYKFRIGEHRNLPTGLFAYVLYRFKEIISPNLAIVSLEDLRWRPHSPGRLLCLDNRAILQRLEELENRTSLARVIRTAGLNMVALDEEKTSFEVLESYYRHSMESS